MGAEQYGFMSMNAPFRRPLLIVLGDGRRPRLENLHPPLPLKPNAILLRPESLHPLSELVLQLSPVVILKLDLRIHLEIHVVVVATAVIGRIPRRGNGGLVELVLLVLTTTTNAGADAGAVRGAVIAIAVGQVFDGFAREGGGAEGLLGNVWGVGAFARIL